MCVSLQEFGAPLTFVLGWFYCASLVESVCAHNIGLNDWWGDKRMSADEREMAQSSCIRPDAMVSSAQGNQPPVHDRASAGGRAAGGP